jgi:DNA-directed RNA polymerase specialized sigma24 family protein
MLPFEYCMSVSVDGPDCKNARFCTTQWSLVVRANSLDGGAVADALENLCRIYWRPIFDEIRRRGWPEADSKDLAQDFFVRLLKRDAFGKADREKGRLRTYLLGALDYFLIDVARARQAVKRGGDAVMLPIGPGPDGAGTQDPPDRGATPAEAFDQSWSLVLMDRALEALRNEYVSSGRETIFAAVEPFLTREAEGDEYRQVSQNAGMTAQSFAVAVHRVRRRYRSCVREQVEMTVADLSDVDQEMHHLFGI